jgi:pimeloyl-ACP methyl ester carboxylesterase
MSSSTITTKDGTEIYYKDWGKGPVVTFSHGWPLNSDAWDGQMFFLASDRASFIVGAIVMADGGYSVVIQ